MATTGAGRGMDERCGVCKRSGGNLRLLPCKHCFCVVCLNERTSRDDDGILVLECPRCHVIIDFDDGDSPDILPAVAGSGDVNVSDIGTSGVKVAHCSVTCRDNHVAYCLECNRGLCKTCVTSHISTPNYEQHPVQMLETAKCATPEVAYGHPAPTLYCLICKQCICQDCASDLHPDHVIKNIDDVGEETRQALAEFVHVTCGSDPDERLERCHLTLKTLQRKYATLDRDVMTWARELRHITGQIHDLETNMAAVDMAKFARYLCGEADDKDLMAHAAHFPLFHTTTEGATVGKSVTSVFTRQVAAQGVDSPKMTRPRLTLKTSIPSPTHTHAPPSTPILPAPATPTSPSTPSTLQGSGRFSRRPLADISEDDVEPPLTLRTTVTPRGVCGGLTLDPRAGEMVVRTSDPSAPIKVYNHSGDLVRGVGGEVEGLTGVHTSGIAVDTCRHLYLVTTPGGGGGGGGSVLLLDREGRKVKSVEGLRAGALYGVAYGEQDDLYALADWDKNQVS